MRRVLVFLVLVLAGTASASPFGGNNQCNACIWAQRPDLEGAFRGFGWDTGPSKHDAIVDEWCNKVSEDSIRSCNKVKVGACAAQCGGGQNGPPNAAHERQPVHHQPVHHQPVHHQPQRPANNNPPAAASADCDGCADLQDEFLRNHMQTVVAQACGGVRVINLTWGTTLHQQGRAVDFHAKGMTDVQCFEAVKGLGDRMSKTQSIYHVPGQRTCSTNEHMHISHPPRYDDGGKYSFCYETQCIFDAQNGCSFHNW